MSASSPEQLHQERQFHFPYHYIPARHNDRIVYAAVVDWAPEYLNSIDLVASVLEESGARRVADLGCGDGRILNELAPRFPQTTFVGMDYSDRAVSLAELYRTGDNVSFRCTRNVKEWEGPPAPFEVVTAIEVLEHIPPAELPEFVRGLGRIVAPGGTLFVTVPHRNRPTQKKHFQHFSGASLRETVLGAIGERVSDDRLLFFDPLPSGLGWLRSKLARNRLFTIEPLFQADLRRRAGVRMVPEEMAGRVGLLCRFHAP